MKLQSRFALACIIDTIDTRRRRCHRQAVNQLINNQDIPLFPCRIRRVLPYNSSEFQLDNFTNDWCIEYLRFSAFEIREILPFLRLDLVPWRNRYKPSPEAAFCLVLYKLSWPHRLKDSINLFGRSLSWQSSIYNDTLQYLVQRVGIIGCRRHRSLYLLGDKLLGDAESTKLCIYRGLTSHYVEHHSSNSILCCAYNHHHIPVISTQRYRGMLYWDCQCLNLDTIRRYASIIEEKIGVSDIWAFIDNTIRPICCPSSIPQRLWYTGYKKLHRFKFQAISTLDGLIISLAGPTRAADRDWTLWYQSEIESILHELFDGLLPNQEPLIFGDPAYKGGFGIMCVYVRQPG
jgi:hypothetical protein